MSAAVALGSACTHAPPRPRRAARRAAPGRRRRFGARRRPRGRGRGRPRPARGRRRPGPRRRGVEGERRRRRADLRPVVADRPGPRAGGLRRRQPACARLRLGPARRGGPARARRRPEGDAHRLRARAGVDEPLARRAATRATSPTRPSTRTSRPPSRAATAPTSTATSSGTSPTFRRGCSPRRAACAGAAPRRAAPLPRAGARRLPGHQGGGPRRRGADRRDVLARPGAAGAQLDAAPAAVRARAGLRLRQLPQAAQRATARASSPRGRTASRSTRTGR